MPDADIPAQDVRYALEYKTATAARKVIRSLPAGELDYVAKVIADHLRLCRWRKEPPELGGPSFWARMPKG